MSQFTSSHVDLVASRLQDYLPQVFSVLPLAMIVARTAVTLWFHLSCQTLIFLSGGRKCCRLYRLSVLAYALLVFSWCALEEEVLGRLLCSTIDILVWLRCSNHVEFERVIPVRSCAQLIFLQSYDYDIGTTAEIFIRQLVMAAVFHSSPIFAFSSTFEIDRALLGAHHWILCHFPWDFLSWTLVYFSTINSTHAFHETFVFVNSWRN